MTFRLLPLSLAALLCACGTSTSTADAGQPEDAGDPADAGGSEADASTPDAGAGRDASTTPVDCTPNSNAGCPSGSQCTVLGFDSNGILQLTCEQVGTGAKGSACTTSMDCGPKLGCLTMSTSEATCMAFCDSSTRCQGSAAIPENCGKLVSGASWGLCFSLPPCDPFAQVCLAAGRACYPASGGFGCMPEGSLQPGADCTRINACAKGSACDASSATCRTLCNPDVTPSTCPGQAACAKQPSANYGYCP